MNAPFVLGRALVNVPPFDEGCEGFVESGSGGEWPDGGSLSLERALLGGIELNGLFGHGLGDHGRAFVDLACGRTSSVVGRR